MIKEIKPYKQRGDTCAICCLMMVLEYYGKIEKANWYDERKLYKIYGSKYMNGTPLSAIALNLVKKGLNTKIYHSEKHFFTNKNKVLPETNFELAMKEYIDYLDAAIRFGIEIKNGMNINTQLLKTEIQQGNLIILAGELTGVYHTILILEYDNNKFTVFDPLYKNKQERTDIELENFINTGIGKWFISVNNKKNK